MKAGSFFSELFTRCSANIRNFFKSRKNAFPENRQLPQLPAKSERCVTVVIPALNEEKNIVGVITYALADPMVCEVIVIDDCSIDLTAQLAEQAGAKIITSAMLGKGVSMKEGVMAASCDLIAYLDGDLSGMREGIITRLCLPLINDEADLVKGKFSRDSGRVTELLAKPMLKIFFPALTSFTQPLGGIVAARKSLLKTLDFENDYGADVGLLIDAYLCGARLMEVDIGSIHHESQALSELAFMANDVGRVILSRAKDAGKLNVDQIFAMHEEQRLALSEVESVLIRRKGRERLLLLDMDGTVTASRFIVELAQLTGHVSTLMEFLDSPKSDTLTRSENIAKIFKFTHKSKFEEAARNLKLRDGVIDFIKEMKKRGFMVGIISDSYFVAAEIIRKRIFAHFAIAHAIRFEYNVSTDQFRINPAFLDESGGICKSNTLDYFRNDDQEPKIKEIWVIGDNENDLALMKKADRAFVIEPKSDVFDKEDSIIKISSFQELNPYLPPK